MGGHGESRNLDNLPWRAAEVCELARGIWKNFLQKTVVPNRVYFRPLKKV